MPGLRDPRVDLLAGQLAALTGLGALGHLDLDVLGVRQVLRGHAEPAGRDLLDLRATRRVVQPLRILATLTGVRLAADPVHRDRQGLVRLHRDGAVRHGAGGEARDDRLDRLDLVQVDRLTVVAELQQPAQRHQPLGGVVHPLGVLLEDVVAAVPGGVLEPEDGLRVEEVLLPLAAPLVVPADLQPTVRQRDAVDRVGDVVAGPDLEVDLLQAQTADLRGGAGEVLVDQLLGQPDGLEDLRAGVGGHGGDAHLGHHLQHALAQRLGDVGHGPGRLDRHEGAGAGQVLGGLEDQVRVDRCGAVTDQGADVVHLADVAGLDDDPDLGAGLLPDQVVVDRGGEQQRRDRRPLLLGVPVGEHQDAGPVGDRRGGLLAQLVEPVLQGLGARLDRVEPAQDVRLVAGQVAVLVDPDDLGQLVVVEDRERQHDLAAGRRARLEQVLLRADGVEQAGDQFLTDGVQRRVRHLGEVLDEVVEHQLRALRQHRDGRVGAHRADRLGTGVGHRRDDLAQLLLGVAEDLLAAGDRRVGVHDVLAHRQLGQVEAAFAQPVSVRCLGRQAPLDLLVGDDAVLGEVGEEHLAGLQPALGAQVVVGDVEHAGLRGQHHQAVVGDPVATGTQAVAVEDRADLGAVGERHAGRAVPRLHQAGVVGVEVAHLLGHVVVVLPGLRDHHQHRVRQAATAEIEQLDHGVEGRRVGRRRLTDREEPVERARDQRGVEQRLPGAHPVLVAADGVDLAVVGDHPERVRELPGRESVGGEPGVHHGQRGGHPLVVQLGEDLLQLHRGQHALVHQGAGGQRREVDLGLALGAPAQAVHHPVDLEAAADPGGRGDDQVLEVRHDVQRDRAQRVGDDRHRTPADDPQALLEGDLLDLLAGGAAAGLLGRQEGHADRVRAGRRELELAHVTQERVGHLEQDARTVAGGFVGAGGTAVVEVAQGLEALLEDPVGRFAAQRGDEGHTTRIVFVHRVVETLAGDALPRLERTVRSHVLPLGQAASSPQR
ncbi:hypothetical protein SDC9_60142 [bioreactor metagenome]|uniref:Uncharacterized protein n=1 Tax=bioreactor metagenome TaxID=1076179 RepID=A0A644XHX2_9ZZZZ